MRFESLCTPASKNSRLALIEIRYWKTGSIIFIFYKSSNAVDPGISIDRSNDSVIASNTCEPPLLSTIKSLGLASWVTRTLFAGVSSSILAMRLFKFASSTQISVPGS